MKKLLIAMAGVITLVVSNVQAEEKYSHFPSVDSPDLKTAMCHLAQYNKKLKGLTDNAELSVEDAVKVHELTYTLEKAVARLQTALTSIADDLEKVHKASEHLDRQAIASAGQRYLAATSLITSAPSCQ